MRIVGRVSCVHLCYQEANKTDHFNVSHMDSKDIQASFSMDLTIPNIDCVYNKMGAYHSSLCV